jgi:tetratricopeptide (TPR) repeat protein
VWPRAVGFYRVGQFYLDEQRYADARDMFEKALAVLPRRYAPIHLNLARVYEKLGDSNRARDEYQTYLKLAPEAPERKEIQRKISDLIGISNSLDDQATICRSQAQRILFRPFRANAVGCCRTLGVAQGC